MDWARYDKQTKQPCGMACFRCDTVVKNSYRLLTFAQVVAKAQVEPEFRKEVKKAVKAAEKTDLRNSSKTFPLQDADCVSHVGYKVAAHLLLLSPEQAETALGMKLADANMPLDCFEDEQGKECKGLLIQNPDMPYKTVTVYHTFGSALREHVHSSADQLRPDEGRELHQWHAGKVTAELPKALRSPDRAPTLEELKDIISKRIAHAKASAPASALTAPPHRPRCTRTTASSTSGFARQ